MAQAEATSTTRFGHVATCSGTTVPGLPTRAARLTGRSTAPKSYVMAQRWESGRPDVPAVC